MTGNKNLYLDLYLSATAVKHDMLYHQLAGLDAYDGWRCIMYGKEIVLSRELFSRSDLKFEDIPRKERNVLLFLILKAMPHLKNVTELGSSLSELIDGLETTNKYFVSKGVKGLGSDISGYHFTGIERSAFLCQMATHLHHGYRLTLFDDCHSAPDHGGILFDRAVSSCVFTKPQALAGFLNKFNAALLNLFVSKGETFISTGAVGSFTYFSIKELANGLVHPLFHLFGYKSPSVDRSMGREVIEGFFFYGPRETAEKFIQESQIIPEVKAYFSDKEIYLKDVRTLF